MFEILQPEKLLSSSNEEMLNASGKLSAKYSKDISVNLCDQLKALKTCLKSEIKKISSIKELIELLLVKFNILASSFPENLQDKRASGSSESRWSPSPKDTRNPRGVTLYAVCGLSCVQYSITHETLPLRAPPSTLSQRERMAKESPVHSPVAEINWVASSPQPPLLVCRAATVDGFVTNGVKF
ncbi:hypothetical protein EVAR_67842_1 [Eumeta japonica]|uniref:Uncharacterized protein n=1 Tax=Eumeta variegata TaxID=151549 RepID=A0A4C2ABM5_EUMVA|nr:hypothetical protein EVAR_67842_1 [Eumeta japonica]